MTLMQSDSARVYVTDERNASRFRVGAAYTSTLLAIAGCGEQLPADVATATIGPGGGELRLDGLLLTIPADALLEPMSITVTRTSESPPAEYDAFSHVYQVEPYDFEMPRHQVRVAIRADDVVQSELMWTAADGLSYEPRPGLRGPDFVSAGDWRFGRMFVGSRRACASPSLDDQFVATDPAATIRGFGWSFSRDGLRQRLVIAELDAGGFLQVEEFDANTLAFVRRTVTDVALSQSVQPVVDRYEVTVYAGTSDGGVAFVGIDAAGIIHVEQFPARGELLRLEVRAKNIFTEVDALARGVGVNGELGADHFLVQHYDGFPALISDGYTVRSSEVTAPILDAHASIDSCDQENFRAVLNRHPDGTADLIQFTGSAGYPQLSQYGVLGVDGVGAIATTVTTAVDHQSFDAEFEEYHPVSPLSRWVVPRSTSPPLITAHQSDPTEELSLPPGGAIAAADLDGDLMPEILRLDGTGTVQFVDPASGIAGEMQLPLVSGPLQLGLGVRSVVDHDADLCAKPRPMPVRPGFAVATSAPAGMVVYRPSCAGL